MTYLQLGRQDLGMIDWRRGTLAPAPLRPWVVAGDYWLELEKYRRSRLPIVHAVGFSILWLLQRVAYSWGWRTGPGRRSPRH